MKTVVRCTGKHADLIERGIKTFMLRWDDPGGSTGDFQSGKYLTIIRYDGRFQNQRRVTADNVIITGVTPFTLTPEGMTVGQTGRALTQVELHSLAMKDGFNNYSEMAFHYLTRRTAYHNATKDRPRKSFSGKMITWKCAPSAGGVFRTSNIKQKSDRAPSHECTPWT
jgi:hypothetical protein